MEKKTQNILILTYWDYQDALIQTYTLPYVRIISRQISAESKLFLVTLDKKATQNDSINPENNIENISILYEPFGWQGLFMWIKTMFQLIRLIRKKNISVIHAWCTPAGGMGYILAFITGKKLIIDSFEPHALPMIEGNTWKKNSIAFKLLYWLEKKQLQKSSEVICAVEGMIEHSKKVYGITKKKYFVKPACVDLKMFSADNLKNKILLDELNLNNKITCVYAGKFGGLYLEQKTFDFFKTAFDFWGERFRILLLSNHSDEEITSYMNKANLPATVFVKKFVSHHEIPTYIGLADFAICPMKPLPSRRFCTPIKNGEYWALGLPVVITKNISDDSDIIKENEIGSVLEELNPEAYLKSIKEINTLLKNNSRMELYNKIRPIAEKYRNFEIAEKVYKQIYGI